MGSNMILNFVIRCFNLPSARLNKAGGWTFAETPFSAISRSNWSLSQPK